MFGVSSTSLSLQPEAIPDIILNSSLMRKGGFDILVGLLDERSFALMLREALDLFAVARVSEVVAVDKEEGRGGNPERCYLVAAGGPVQDAFYCSEALLRALRQVTGTPLVPSGERGTYSYYARPGDYLALHRDIVTCDVAVITCLSDGPVLTDTGGILCLYPERIYEPLSAIRAAPGEKVVGVRLLPRQTLVFFGGIVPHMLLPVTENQARIISVLCYRVPLE